ncbi:MAG: VWA domain-containing protein [Candidatus Acidiferrales bacterium]|jgi:VWFA-related protein
MRKFARTIAPPLVVAFLVAGLALAQSPQQSANPSAQPSTNQSAPVAVPMPASVPGSPQSSKQSPVSVLRTSSDLVRIDVEVTDKSGKPIKGLRADQFVVTDNGKRQDISSFSYADIESIEAAGAEDAKPIVVPVDNDGPNAPSAEAISDQLRDRRLIVLFFDITSMQTDDLIRAHDAAQKFVKQQMTKADVVAVVAFSTRITVLANFTNDRATINKAIAQLTANSSSDLASPLYAAAENGEYDVQEYTGAAFTPDETEFNVFNTDQKLAAVEGLANVLGGIPGRKALVEFTGGITQTGEENRTQLRAATDAANRADVSIYSIDSRGLFAVPPGGDTTTNAATGTSMFTGASVFHQTDQREDSRDTLATLSTDTGGKAFFDLGDLSEAFPKIQQDNTGYYLIGYRLGADVKRDGRWRAIRVKVSAPGAHIRYREGYYAPRDFQHLEKEDRDQQLADAVNSDNPVVELPVAVETGMFRLSEQQTYIPVAAKISASALDWAEKHGKREAEFDFAVDVRAVPSGQAVAQLRDTTQVNLDPERFQQINQKNLLYQGGVVLAPGNYRLKFVARENESGKIGTFEENLVVAPAQPGKMTLSSVLLSSQLVPVQKSSEVQTKGQGVRAKLANSPLEINGETIVPSVTRLFTQSQTLYVFFQAYFPEKTENKEAFDGNSLRAGLIFFRNGLQVNATPLLAPSEVDAKKYTASFRISLPLAKLQGGRYTVQAVVIAPGTQHSAFNRAYLALQYPPPAQSAPSPATTPASPTPPAETPKPPSR